MSKYGRPKLSVEALRKHRIGVRVSPVEFAELKAKAKVLAIKPGAYLRMSALDRRLPSPPVPAANRELYSELARLAANLNQLAHSTNAGNTIIVDDDLLTDTFAELRQLRLALLGLGHDS